MKRVFLIKIAALAMIFAVLLCVMIMPAFSLGKTNWDGNLKASGDDYELPFVPIETNHDWDNGMVTTPPTCTQPGVKTYTCKINSKHTKTEEIPATGHTPAEAVRENEVATTCSVEGHYDEVVYCSVCNFEISREKKTIPIDESLHNTGEWEVNGIQHWHVCSNCGKKIDEEEHLTSDWIIDVQPTTESFGRKHMECSVCGCVLAEQEILKIPRYTPGDINDDGKVNNKDLIRLFQYLSDWDVKVNEYALDINGDNAINNKDLTRLFQFLSDWDVEISVKNVYEMIPTNYKNSKTGFLWPVAGYYDVSRPFGNSNGSFHAGIDISGTGIVGQPIFAIADGVVYQSNKSWTPESGRSGNASYGNYCVINHGNITINGSSAKYVAFYAHATSIIVSVGETVKKGQIIGYVGSTGNATSPHLHIGIQKNGNWVNPYALLWE